MSKTLQGRIAILLFCLVIMTALIGLAAGVNLWQLSHSIDGLMTANYRSIKLANQMLEDLEEQDRAILTYLRVDARKGLRSFSQRRKRFRQTLEMERRNITEPGERNRVKRLGDDYARFVTLMPRFQNIAAQKGLPAALSFYESDFRPQISAIKHHLRAIAKLNEKAMFRSKNRATNNAAGSMYFILLISLGAVCGSLIAARYFLRLFFEPVLQLTKTVRQVKSGAFNCQAPVVYQDEIGELATEFNQMTRRLKEYEQSSVGRLLAEKNKSLAIVKSISDPLVVLNKDLQIQLINAAGEEFFAVKEQQVLNGSFLELSGMGEVAELITGVLQDHAETLQRIIGFQNGKQELFFNVVTKAVQDGTAEINSVIVLFQNITQLKQLERLKTDFVATVSHEFKTPLTSIMMGVSLLEEEKLGILNEKQKATILSIQEEGESLTTLVNDLLEISRIESKGSILKIQLCSILGLFEAVMKKFGESAARKEINLHFEAEDDLPKVQADPEKILWVLNNLVSNALKYTSAGDEIIIGAAVKYDELCITVQDTGPGIPAAYLDKLFDKYVQVQGYDLEFRGTGLGLAIAKEIVEAHGGEIWCESKIDVGSTFTFTIPWK